MSDNNTPVDWDNSPEGDNADETYIDIADDASDFDEAPVSEVVVRNADDEIATLVQLDNDGKEVISEINFSSPPLTRDEAVELTDRIKTTTNVLYLLIKRAHAGKAYEALGYTTFQDYIAGEFSFSKVYAYRLLNQANFIEAIAAKVPEGTEIRVSEPVSKKLKHVLPELLEEVTERTAGVGAEEAGAVIEDIIRERREQQAREAEEAADAELEDDGFSGGGNGEGKGHYVDDFEDEDIDFEDDDSDSLLNEDSADIRRKFDKLYNLYTGLKNINAVGEGEELIAFLPPERWEEFGGLFESVIPWLTDFNVKFQAHRAEQEANGETGDSDTDDAEFSEDFE